MDINNKHQKILTCLLIGAKTLTELIEQPTLSETTERTLQRYLKKLLESGLVVRHGEARSITYSASDKARVQLNLSNEVLKDFFNNEDRQKISYDFKRLDNLSNNPLFSEQEIQTLERFNNIFVNKLKNAPIDIIRRERERITIELSWKSSKIEGNTYSLLETETLIKEGLPAVGKSSEETKMVINHKRALDFTEQNREIFSGNISPASIINLHKILGEGIIDMGLRKGLIGITGSFYSPLDNVHQISEELEKLCEVINKKKSIFEKSLIAFTYICYLQPFNDGNKRTARILANSILYSNNAFPLSLRAVDVDTYKLAILAFYELGILGNSKQVFIDQAKFAAENYAI